MKKIALLGSGDGGILKAVREHFENSDVTLFCLSDDESSDFFKQAKELNLNNEYLPCEMNFEYFSTHDFNLVALYDYRGELKEEVLKTGKFISVHDSLLPAFDEPDPVYKAFCAGVKVSGITVHLVAPDSDNRRIIAQYPVLIGNLTHFDEFKKEIINLENVLYPVVMEKVLNDGVFDFPDLLGKKQCEGCCGH